MSQSRTRGPNRSIRVGDDFEDEYPGASALATECYANLWRAADLLMGLHNRQTLDQYQLSPSARGVLAVVEGAGQPLEPSVIAERPHGHDGLDDLTARQPREARPGPPAAPPEDRRKLLIDITPDAQAIVDELLPALHARERDVMGAALTTSEQRTLLRHLAKLQQAGADAPAPAPDGAIRRRATRPKADPCNPTGGQP